MQRDACPSPQFKGATSIFLEVFIIEVFTFDLGKENN